LASYSDDELNDINTESLNMTKEEHRRSMDDAWVDILVASHLRRRAGNLNAELRRPAGDPLPRNVSRQDPEMASLGVTEVLASVRGLSPLFGGESVDIEPMNVPHRSKIDSLPVGSSLEEQYATTISGSPDLMEPEEVPGVEPAPPRPQRRMACFDMHPDIRNVVAYAWEEAETKTSLISLHVLLMQKRSTNLRERVTSQRASILQAPHRPPRR